jgi:hypothetical protein
VYSVAAAAATTRSKNAERQTVNKTVCVDLVAGGEGYDLLIES